jgi:hypothetical protein
MTGEQFFSLLPDLFQLADNDSSCCLLPLRLLRFLLALDGQADGQITADKHWREIPCRLRFSATALPIAAPAGVLLEAI